MLAGAGKAVIPWSLPCILAGTIEYCALVKKTKWSPLRIWGSQGGASQHHSFENLYLWYANRLFSAWVDLSSDHLHIPCVWHGLWLSEITTWYVAHIEDMKHLKQSGRCQPTADIIDMNPLYKIYIFDIIDMPRFEIILLIWTCFEIYIFDIIDMPRFEIISLIWTCFEIYIFDIIDMNPLWDLYLWYHCNDIIDIISYHIIDMPRFEIISLIWTCFEI